MGKTGLDRMLVGNFDEKQPGEKRPGEKHADVVTRRRPVFRFGQTHVRVRLTRSEVNWASDQKMVELIANGNRFAWRVCSECAKYDRWNNNCEVIGGKTTKGSGCDCWLDVSY